MNRRVLIVLAAAALFAVTPPMADAQSFLSTLGDDSSGSSAVTVELVSEAKSVQPGTPFWVGVKLTMRGHWHVYWKNPGVGLPTEVAWELPPGWTAGEINWPYPTRLSFADMVTYGYERQVVLLVPITPAADAATGGRATLTANGSWLECGKDSDDGPEACVPGSGTASLELPVAAAAPQDDPRWTQLFAEARQRLPATATAWRFEAALAAASITLVAHPPAGAAGGPESASFFPGVAGLIEDGGAQTWQRQGDRYTMQLVRDTGNDETPTHLNGVLVADVAWPGTADRRALAVDVPFGELSVPVVAAAPAPASSPGMSFAGALMFAFFGGLILNLMPCVFPVLSLKVMGFVNQAAEDHGRPWLHGAAFAAGVLISFWALAGAFLLLRHQGQEIGWGFQLQSVRFLVVMATVFFIFGLNLFGVFEIGVSLTGAGSKLSQRSGLAGSFFSGLLATVVATPCTAPFMGSALGFALGLDTLSALLVFTCLGLGMATPYVLLSSFPALLRYVPRPGPWMESFKQFMGFLLVATVAFLIWVIGQIDYDALARMLTALLLMAVGCWIYGRWGSLARPPRTRVVAVILGLVLVGGGLTHALTEHDDEVAWQAYRPELVAELRAAGQPVFVDFTAAWCVSCQFNEKTVLGLPGVQRAFRDSGVAMVKADWTERDAVIARGLEAFGRTGVPFYVLYGSEPGAPPLIASEVITPQTIKKALASL